MSPADAVGDGQGNLPRGTIRKYMNRPDLFMGPVNTKRGKVYGVWHRPFLRERGTDVSDLVWLRKKWRGEHAGLLP